MTMLKYQIEEILMNAHQSDIDLIEAYFAKQDSLDLITNQAEQILKLHSNPEVQEAIRKNLLECIVVKSQIEQKSLKGLVKKILIKLGFHFGQNKEIIRAESLVEQIKRKKN